MQLIVDSLLTNYAVTGSGKPIVLLHGWGDSQAGFQELAKALSKSYQVISIDLPGFGGSQAPTRAWGLDEYASFVGHFLAKQKISPFAVVGHSNGGAIAIRGLAEGSFATTKLILLASAGIRGEYKGRMKALRYAAKLGKLLVRPLPKSVQNKLRKKVYTSVGSDMLVAEHLQETFKRIVGDDVRADAAKITTPTLLVYGQNDVSTPVKWGRILHENFQNSEFVVVPDAEHFVHHDQPQAVLQQVQEFLA